MIYLHQPHWNWKEGTDCNDYMLYEDDHIKVFVCVANPGLGFWLSFIDELYLNAGGGI